MCCVLQEWSHNSTYQCFRIHTHTNTRIWWHARKSLEMCSRWAQVDRQSCGALHLNHYIVTNVTNRGSKRWTQKTRKSYGITRKRHTKTRATNDAMDKMRINHASVQKHIWIGSDAQIRATQVDIIAPTQQPHRGDIWIEHRPSAFFLHRAPFRSASRSSI